MPAMRQHFDSHATHIKVSFKQSLVRAALGFLRGLVAVKRVAGPVGRVLAWPFVRTGSFLLSWVGIPLYRGYFFFRRLLGQMAGAAKHRALFIMTSRQLVHVVIIVLTIGVSISNVRAQDAVRSETYGRHSILYRLVADEVLDLLETEGPVTFRPLALTSYLQDPSVSSDAHLDFTSFDSEYAVTTVGGVLAPLPNAGAPVGTRPPVPSRTETETYRVQSGDTLGGIADAFGLNLSSLLWANNLSTRSLIRIGQELKIPPVDGVYYTVKKGDTVAKIAKTYGTDADKIIAFNRLDEAAGLKVGAELVLPDGEPPAPPVVAVRPAPVTSLFVPKPAGQTTPEARGSSTGKGTWVWPTDWRVITQYFGWKHTGIDVDGDYTTRSFAAADGTVIYSGWRNGYGSTVEIDHGGGLITRYGHHSKLYVKVGDVVKAGDIIAQTGTTGRSTGTHLHFEVIKNGKFQNPLEYIR